MGELSKAQSLLKLLADAGLTQAQIGALIGVTQATVSRMASGDIADPRASTMERLEAAVLRTTTRAAA